MTVLPTRASFRGMPAARWWQEEDASIDLGGVEANAADLPRMALLQFGLVFGNDHFVLPVGLPVGAVFRTTHLLVTDTFGVSLVIDPAAHAGPAAAAAKARTGGRCSPSLWPTGQGWPTRSGPGHRDTHADRQADRGRAPAPGRDGEPCLGRRGGGGRRRRPARRAERPLPEQPEQPDTGPLRYRLGSTVPPNWYPLTPRRTATGDVPDLVLERMAYSTEEPLGQLLRVGLTVDDDRIPREGRRVLRERVQARWTDGTPYGWTRRRAATGRGEGSSGLSFDDALPGPGDQP